jgi:hypothetical protein
MLSIDRPSLPSLSNSPSFCHVFVGERLQFSLQLSAASLAAHGWCAEQLLTSCFSADLVAHPQHDVRGHDDTAAINHGNELVGLEQSQQRRAEDVPVLRRRSSIEPEDESILVPLPSIRAPHAPRMSALPDGGVCVHFEMDIGMLVSLLFGSCISKTCPR